METLLLPGMDGTGRLFARFTPRLDSDVHARVLSYPPDRALGYEELLDVIGRDLPAGPFAVVAESFSGPIGVLLASRHPDRVRRLVLVATFARSPSAFTGWAGALAELVGSHVPDVVLRHALVGADADDALVANAREAIGSIDARVLGARLRAIADVDVSREFATLSTPVLYLAGAHDVLVGAGVRDALSALRPEMEVEVLDAPHLVVQRRPAECAALVSRFVGQQHAGATQTTDLYRADRRD